jgi:hypothetical protein
MSEQSHRSFDAYHYPSDTTFIRSGDIINIQGVGSELPTKEEGLARARQTIEAAFGGERPHTPTAQYEIATIGFHVGDLRGAKRNEVAVGDEQTFAFRPVPAGFDRRTLRTLEDDLLSGDSEEARQLREANELFQRNSAQMEQDSRQQSQFPQQPTQTDMMGYELTNAGK